MTAQRTTLQQQLHAVRNVLFSTTHDQKVLCDRLELEILKEQQCLHADLTAVRHVGVDSFSLMSPPSAAVQKEQHQQQQVAMVAGRSDSPSSAAPLPIPQYTAFAQTHQQPLQSATSFHVQNQQSFHTAVGFSTQQSAATAQQQQQHNNPNHIDNGSISLRSAVGFEEGAATTTSGGGAHYGGGRRVSHRWDEDED